MDRLAALTPATALRRARRLLDNGNAERGFALLARAARAGMAEAQYRVGRCYLQGSLDPPTAICALALSIPSTQTGRTWAPQVR
jgi:TPR repeat protein